jgi:hypothetical protein
MSNIPMVTALHHFFLDESVANKSKVFEEFQRMAMGTVGDVIRGKIAPTPEEVEALTKVYDTLFHPTQSSSEVLKDLNDGSLVRVGSPTIGS